MMYCVNCEKLLEGVPIFNGGEEDKYASSLLFCVNPKCKRHGLLTVTFKSAQPIDGKSKRKRVQ